jgi:hypothetical protein
MWVKNIVAHKSNPLHVFCRLKNVFILLGASKECAARISTHACSWYEVFIFRPWIARYFKINLKGR